MRGFRLGLVDGSRYHCRDGAGDGPGSDVCGSRGGDGLCSRADGSVCDFNFGSGSLCDGWSGDSYDATLAAVALCDGDG